MCRFIYILVFIVVVLLSSHGRAGDLIFYVGQVYPFTIVNQDGLVSGTAVDVVSEIMEMVDKPMNINDIKSINWARAVEETETRKGTALFSVARTPQREHKFKWVGPIAELNIGLVGKKFPRKVIKSPMDLFKYKIGAIRKSAPAQILESKYGISADKLTLLKKSELQFRMLDKDRVDLITVSDTAALNWLEKFGMAQSEFEMVYVLKHLSLYIAFNRQTDDDFIAELQTALDKLKEKGKKGQSRYEMIIAKSFGEGPIALQQH